MSMESHVTSPAVIPLQGEPQAQVMIRSSNSPAPSEMSVPLVSVSQPTCQSSEESTSVNSINLCTEVDIVRRPAIQSPDGNLSIIESFRFFPAHVAPLQPTPRRSVFGGTTRQGPTMSGVFSPGIPRFNFPFFAQATSTTPEVLIKNEPTPMDVST